jgi:hypothetical protein
MMIHCPRWRQRGVDLRASKQITYKKAPTFLPSKKHHRTKEEVTLMIIGRTNTWVSRYMLEGSPSTQQASPGVLHDLAMPENNVSKVIVTLKTLNGTPTKGMSQDTCKILIHSKKIKKSG